MKRASGAVALIRGIGRLGVCWLSLWNIKAREIVAWYAKALT